MKNITVIALLLISNLIFSQKIQDNEKEIKNIENYNTEEITAKINEDITIFGSLITPKSDFDNVLVIVSGTGRIAQKAHNYLIEFLLQNKIGVFIFDKRGVGKSTGEYNDEPKIYTSDFIEIYNEFKKSKTIENKKIGFLGHSLGGIITIQAIENKTTPDFLIQWSAPIGKPRYLLKYQIEKGIKNYDKLIVGKNTEEQIIAINYAHELIDKYPNKNASELWKIGKKESKEANVNKSSFSGYLLPRYVEFARIDNTKTFENIDFPTLVIIGEDDILVDPIQSKIKLDEIGNNNITFIELQGLNHFMTKKGTDEKTNQIYNVDLSFKEYILNWINDLKK